MRGVWARISLQKRIIRNMRSETMFEMGKKKIKKSKPGEDSKYDFNLKSLGRGNIFRVKWFWFSSCRNLNRKRTWCERYDNREKLYHENLDYFY